MESDNKEFNISKKIYNIISKYFSPEIFKEVDYSFTPLCIIKVRNDSQIVDFEDIKRDFENIGFKVKFYPLTKKEYLKYKLEHKEDNSRYSVSFAAEKIQKSEIRKKKFIIPTILLVLTLITIYFSAVFYITYIEPYYGDSNRIISSIISFCLGMFLIIVIHEFGHIYFSHRHKIKTSVPYLIPGPPPIGMFGAFVSIKDDPSTRNQKFDVVIGGIVLGIIISCVLIIAGFLFSIHIDTETYIQYIVAYSGDSATEVAMDISQDINSFNILFQTFRYLFFPFSSYQEFYGVLLPTRLIIIHPLAYSGWIGLLLSGLNLIPITFFDGGHLLKAIFPGKYTKLIGLGIGTIIWLILDIEMWYFAIWALPGALRELNAFEKPESVPYPLIPLTRSRKIIAVFFLGFFIVLWPLTFNNALFGISA